MDFEGRQRWNEYSRAKDDMFAHCDLPDTPWWEVEADDKMRARINCIAHLLSMVPTGAQRNEDQDGTAPQGTEVRAAATGPVPLCPRPCGQGPVGHQRSRRRQEPGRRLRSYCGEGVKPAGLVDADHHVLVHSVAHPAVARVVAAERLVEPAQSGPPLRRLDVMVTPSTTSFPWSIPWPQYPS